MDPVVARFQGFPIHQNENGFHWCRGGYYHDLAACQNDIASYNWPEIERDIGDLNLPR